MVPGGGAMFLNEAFRSSSKINILPMHHEQACAMAAEGFTKTSNKPAILSVTTGPGAINALNGVHGAYTDSIPMFIVSGQVKRETYGPVNSKKIRQLGDQEVDIVSMVRKITKYSKTILNIDELDETLETAYNEMITGRKGPVWIDVPIDIQSTNIKSKRFSNVKIPNPIFDLKLEKFYNLLKKSSKPVVVVGSGVRLSESQDLLIKFIEKFNIPIVTTFNSHDLISSDHRLYVGRQGTIGDRSGNFAVENADLLLILGSRMNIRQIGYNFKSFSKNSKKIMVDIDNAELNKHTLKIDLKILSDLNYFLSSALKLKEYKNDRQKLYLDWSKDLQKKYELLPKKVGTNKKINPYNLFHLLNQYSQKGDIFVTADGSAAVMSSQTLKIKSEQRLFSNSGAASMGYGLPAAIGASVANLNKKIICIEGDGSIQMNIQELATMKSNKLKIKLIIIENGGYLSIKQTQERFFNGNYIACGPDSGLGFPNLSSLCEGYGLNYSYCDTYEDTEKAFIKYLNNNKQHVFIISVDRNQQFEPKPSSKRLSDGTMVSLPLDDLYPFLPKKELEDIRKEAEKI